MSIHLAQTLDTSFKRRMGAEQAGDAVPFQRIGEKEMRRGGILVLQCAAGLPDFLECTDETFGIARGERAGGIS